MKTGNKKVKIAGAGPSGLTAAINLALEGFDVEVYEKRKIYGARFFGDLQGLENWTRNKNILEEFREMNLHINFDCDSFRSLYLSDGGDVNKELEFNKDLFYLVKRGPFEGSLDHGLETQAKEAGVKIHYSSEIHPRKADIISTGPDNRKIFAIDKGIVFQTSHPDLAAGLVNNKFAHKGYSYLLITKGYGCLCTVLFDRFAEVGQCYDETYRKFRETFDFDIVNPKKAGGLGTFNLKNDFVEEGRLKTGEAAGLQDLLWGFGLRSAVRSGYLAAKAIIEGKDYAQMAGKEFSSRRKATVVLRYMYEKAGAGGYGDIIKKTAKKADTFAYLKKAHTFTPLHRIIYPFALRDLKKRYNSL